MADVNVNVGWLTFFVCCLRRGLWYQNLLDNRRSELKDYLFIIYPFGIFDRESGMVLSEPSRFIREIDDKILEKFILTDEQDSNSDENNDKELE